MIRFESDYLEGAHPQVLEALVRSNTEQHPGYGEDERCERARGLIRSLCAAPEAAVHFLVGGTQVNTTVITAALRPHQGVISADCGHIAVHETGSIEHGGHKVLTAPAANGKLLPEDIPHLLEMGDRRLTGPTMPPQGLYLNRVWYDGAVGEMFSRY